MNEKDCSRRLIILVDYSNLLYRAYFSSIKDLKVYSWIPFTRALEMLRNCVHVCRLNDNWQVEFIFAGDSGRGELERTEFDNSYKATRKPLQDINFFKFRKLMKGILQHLGFDVIYRDGVEGDDILGTFVKQNSSLCSCEKICVSCECEKESSMRMVVFSADQDLNALLAFKQVVIYRAPNSILNRHLFIKEYGFHPKLFSDYKALIGDKSDNIKGVTGWGEVKAKKYIIKGNWIDILKEEGKIAEFEHSKKLVILNYHVRDIPKQGQKLNISDSNNGVYISLMREYGDKKAVDDILMSEKRLEIELR